MGKYVIPREQGRQSLLSAFRECGLGDGPANQLEREIYEYVQEYCNGRNIFGAREIGVNYETRINTIIYNLCPDMNGGQRELLDNLPDMRQLARMAPSDMNPSKNSEQREYINIKMGVQVEKKYSYEYTCPKCKNNEAEVYVYQARSPDEPATVSVKCTYCGKFI